MTFTVDGRGVPLAAGQTVAAAMWAAGIRSWRRTRVAGAPRGLFCGIGACFDCLITIDGVANQRACLVPAQPGMAVTTAAPPDSAGPSTIGPGATGATRCDVAVVGAGPAGLAAASTAAAAGLRVVLLDAAGRPGGQFWRHRAGTRGAPAFEKLWSTVDGRVDYRPDSPVWFVEPGFRLHIPTGVVIADRLVVATGGYDRVLPFPGWELPGVVTAGGAQALLKGSGVPVGTRVVVAGAGPFLLPVAASLATAGARVVGVFEAGRPAGYLRHGLAAGRKMPEAVVYAATLARHRVPYRTGHAVVAARGEGQVSTVDVVRLATGGIRTVECDALAVGWGFTPQLELPLALGCAAHLDVDGSLVLTVDAVGQTSVPGVYAAGEVTGVGGAALAVTEGRLVGAALAGTAPARRLLARRQALRSFAAVMHRVHAPPDGWPQWTDDSTLVCRCEEVPYGRIVHAVEELGATDAGTVKSFVRPGMGWCQGRVCGWPTAALAARLCGREVTAADLTALARRPIAQPVTLGQLGGDISVE